MAQIPGCPQDPVPEKRPFVAPAPIACVLHRTYGGWAGDYQVIKANGTCQILIGKEPGQWVQFMDTRSIAYHCNGANFYAVGVELTGVNEDVLTDWQVQCLHAVIETLAAEHNIPKTYLDPDSVPPASVHVNDGTFKGYISHRSVQTDDGSQQHTDMITVADWYRTETQEEDLTPAESAQLNSVTIEVGNIHNVLQDPVLGLQHQVVNVIPERFTKLDAKLDAILAKLP